MNKPIHKSKSKTSKTKVTNSKARNRKAKVTKKAASVFLNKQRLKSFRKAVKKIQGMTNKKLKDILRANEQSMTGNKDILFSKVAHGMVFGRIPKCSNCSGGRPFFNLQTGDYTCQGYQDDTDWIDCGTVKPYSDLKDQMLPWEMSPITTEDESEEEEEESEEEEEENDGEDDDFVDSSDSE